jgi:esterase/lipase/1-acyl-sn-glycerol-3-phosphate acyltransferase
MEMSDIVVKSTGYVLKFLENMFKDKVVISGTENIPLSPVLFTANHFTRAETLILPYFVHKHTGKLARSLADKKIFKGALGDDPKRNEIIIGDLISGDNNWIIYPEGNMMKNKKVTLKGRKYQLHLADKVRDLFTGSAVMAIKAELLRQDLHKTRDQNTIDKYLLDGRSISNAPVAIVPVNITYYPIRAGQNKLELWIQKFVESISTRFREEVQIEGNILAEATIHIHFCEPIYVDKFISGSKLLNIRLPLIDREKQHDLITDFYRHRLTNQFMSKVYNSTYINLDHIFAATLFLHPHDDIHARELRSRIYMNIKAIEKLGKYRLHPSCKVDAFKILAGRNYAPFKKAQDLAFEQNILLGSEEYEFLQINHIAFNNDHDFHSIRVKNTLKIFVNELQTLTEAYEAIQHNSTRSIEDVNSEIFDILYKRDVENYDADYKKYLCNISKPYEIGKPFFLEAPSKKIGIVLSHGYKSAPEEVRLLAEYLNNAGMNVYCVRLHGHGTAPLNLKHTSWLKWYDSYMRGVVAMQKICDKVIFAGFSTGGLLSLYAASKNATKCDGVISINAALKLNDIRARFVKFVNVWDDLVTKFRRGKGAVEYVEDEPENPNINYSINYLKGVEELGKLMKQVKDNLEFIHAPSLIIQSPKDPIVSPISGKMIFDDIHSKTKKLIEPNVDKHVIVRGNVEKEVFLPIKNFIESICK